MEIQLTAECGNDPPAFEASAEPSFPQLPRIELGISQRACRACNRRKTRCDRRRPSCSCCRRAKSTCEYPTKRKPPQRNLTSYGGVDHVVHDISRLIQLLEQDSTTVMNDTNAIIENVAYTSPSPTTLPENSPSTESFSAALDATLDVQLPWTDYMPDVLNSPPPSKEKSSMASFRMPSFEGILAVDATTNATATTTAVACPPMTIQASISVEFATAMQLLDLFFDHVQS